MTWASRAVRRLRDNPLLQYRSSSGGHIGYEQWHIDMDNAMDQFIHRQGASLTQESLLEFIHNYYQNPGVSWRIPGVDLTWGF